MPEKISFDNPEIPKTTEIPKKEEVLELEPLTEKDKEEVDNLFIKLGDSRNSSRYNEYRWKIAEKLGERAIPHLIENYENFAGVGWGAICFFDTLVTEKTAPMVLEAMKSGKIGIFEAAMGAAAGKEKTAPGLAEILTDLKLSGNRSPHVRLLESLGEAKIDDIVPSIVKFYERLRKDKDYYTAVSGHLKEYGNSLYSADGYDVIRSLSYIDGPKARQAIKRFASSGDEYIKKYAQEAMGGKLYIGHPNKHIIEKPVSQPEFYSIKSDNDLEPEDIPEEPPGVAKISMPEQITSKSKFHFLESTQEWQEKYREYFKDYFNGKLGTFEFLGKFIDKGEVKHWHDFPEGKYGGVLQAAVYLESLKVLMGAPDFKAMQEGTNHLLDHFNKWCGEKASFSDEEASVNFGRILKRCQSFLDDFNQHIGSLKQEDFRLPDSAGEFQLWHKGLKKARTIKPFTELLHGKLQNYFSQESFQALREGTPLSSINERILRILPKLFSLYREVDQYDIPVYKEAAERLEKVAEERSLIFYGRDADYFFYAVKAQRFGLAADKKPREVYINRELSSLLRDKSSQTRETRETRERILAYLLQERVSADALHIDTGYGGSIPEAVIRALNPKLSDREVDERIKLLESREEKRESLRKGEGAVKAIEGRPHKYGWIHDVIRDGKTGRLKVSYHEPQDPWDKIEAWVINQAVIRNFAPRQEKR